MNRIQRKATLWLQICSSIGTNVILLVTTILVVIKPSACFATNIDTIEKL
jgi:hypothetical protein